MDEDEEMAELRAQEARRVRDEAKKCLRHASFQLGKAAYEIDEYLKEFSTARIPIRRQVILNEGLQSYVRHVCRAVGGNAGWAAHRELLHQYGAIPSIPLQCLGAYQ